MREVTQEEFNFYLGVKRTYTTYLRKLKHDLGFSTIKWFRILQNGSIDSLEFMIGWNIIDKTPKFWVRKTGFEADESSYTRNSIPNSRKLY